MSIEIKNDDEYIKDRQRIINNILEDTKIKQQNGRLWTPFHDMQMYEYVIKYNFNFFDIANRFQALCNNKKKYEYSEDAVRLHWAFLHAMRMNNLIPNEKYYQQMKMKYDKEEETTFKTVTQEKKDNMNLSEEEDIKRMKEEFEKMQKEKNMTQEEKNKIKEEEEKKKKEEERKKKEEEKKKKEEEMKKKKKLEEEKRKKLEEKKRLEEENKPLKSSLYKEEPQFIKDLFNKEVPKEIKEKLEQDKGKYTNNNNNNNNKNNNKPIDFSKISHDYTLIPIKPLIQDSTKNNNNNEEEELFPIKSNKQKNSSLESLKEHEKTATKSLESQLKNTKNMNDYIQEDPILKKQYEQLNNFCKFATESINYIVNKETGLDDNTNTTEKKKTIEEANKKLNELFLGPIYQKTKEEGFNLEDFNKKIEEEEHKMYFETTNYDNYIKTIPVDKDQQMKLKKFQEHLFAKANQMSTQELLDRISDIIKQPVSNSSSSTNLSDKNSNGNNNINNRIENALNEVNNNDTENQNLNRQILNTVVRNINNNEDNNNNNNNEDEDQKSEKTKAQSETVNNDVNSSMNQGTISEVSNMDKRYRHVYKGMIYYTDKPDENKKENKNNNNKKNKNSDDELEYDNDSDEEDYNK